MENIRTWEADGFRLEMDYAGFRDGRHYLAYKFYDGDTCLFEGADYSPSPLDAIDSDASVAGLLVFLSLQPGDTDQEYFAAYTPEQLAWAQSYRAAYLASLASEMEDGQ